jgi:hypothetical protein
MQNTVCTGKHTKKCYSYLDYRKHNTCSETLYFYKLYVPIEILETGDKQRAHKNDLYPLSSDNQ